MDAYLCDINQLDSNVLLPPRKRLLAGLKKQNFNGSLHQPSSSATLNEFDARLNNLLRSHLNNPNISSEDLVEASKSAAATAIKAAKAARAAAEEKAEIAAKAVAAAKCALELVATVSEEAISNERHLKKNKMKKHLPVQMLYDKHQPTENCKTDEQLALKLHQAINSSPRISKHSSTCELKSSKHRRLKSLPTLEKTMKSLPTPEKTRVSNGGLASEADPHMSDGNCLIGEVDSESSICETRAVRAEENKSGWLKMDDGEAETSRLKKKILEPSDDMCSIGGKRGRIKQKKLILCKDELNSESSLKTEGSKGKPTSNNMPLFSVEPPPSGMMPVETTAMRKCQAFKAPECVKQNKVMQS